MAADWMNVVAALIDSIEWLDHVTWSIDDLFLGRMRIVLITSASFGWDQRSERTAVDCFLFILNVWMNEWMNEFDLKELVNIRFECND